MYIKVSKLNILLILILIMSGDTKTVPFNCLCGTKGELLNVHHCNCGCCDGCGEDVMCNFCLIDANEMVVCETYKKVRPLFA